MKETVLRYTAFITGQYLQAFAIALMALTSLGVTPISSVNYVLSIHSALSFGEATFIFNLVIVVLQLALVAGRHGTKKERIEILLQLPFLLVFSAFIDLNMLLLSHLPQGNYAWRMGLLLAGCVIQAVAVVLEVRSNVVIMPPEGFVKFAARRLNKNFGLVKVIFDISLLCIALAISLFMSGTISGIREGSIIAALTTGTLAAFISTRIFTPLHLSRFFNKQKAVH